MPKHFNRDDSPKEIWTRKPSGQGGRFRVHLLFPNTYYIGMSSLSFQALLNLFLGLPDIVVERCFAPEDLGKESTASEQWRTIESGRRLSDCDLIAASLSVETDYLGLVSALRGKLAAKRSQGDPIVLVGGTAVTLNPEPIASFVDVFCIGEAEGFLRPFWDVFRQLGQGTLSRAEMLQRCGELEGAYVSSLVEPVFGEHSELIGYQKVASSQATKGPWKPPRRLVTEDIGVNLAKSVVLTPDTEFSNMFLVETGRGCEMGCRFCVSGYAYRPIRKWPKEKISEAYQGLTSSAESIGLVGAAVSSHPCIQEICKEVAASGRRASVSSLMAKRLSPDMASVLQENHVRSVSLAPEAGSERLRFVVGKNVSDEEFIAAAKNVAKVGIHSIKLYFMIGLPEESEPDIDAIVSLATRLQEAAAGVAAVRQDRFKIALSVNAFVPKPCTPYQWEPMADLKYLEAVREQIKSQIRRCRGVEFRGESLRLSVLQAVLSRGDRRLANLLSENFKRAGDWKTFLKLTQGMAICGVSARDYYAYRRISSDEVLPWDVIDCGLDKELLLKLSRSA